MDNKSPLFPSSPTITFYDPLGDLLGVGDGYYEYSFDDAVKLVGHACPTVAGALVMALRVMDELYGEQTPQRGDIRIEVSGSATTDSTGPFTQILTLLTGAAAENGFQGLNGKYVRQGLLGFTNAEAVGPISATFHRISTNTQVKLSYNPSAIPADPNMMEPMGAMLSGTADTETRQQFRELWRTRVERIVADRGDSTISKLE